MFCMAKLSASHCFTKGVSVGVLYFPDVPEYNPPNVQSDFASNLGPTKKA